MSLERVREEMADRGIDYLVLTEEENISYVLGQEASGYVFITEGQVEIVASKFFQYDLESWNVNIAYSRSDFEEILEEMSERFSENVFADSGSEKLQEIFEVEETELVEEARKVKTGEEIKHIREACEITSKALEKLRESLFDGFTEWEAASKINSFYAESGVGSGFVTDEAYDLVHRNCLRPHRNPTDQEIVDEDLVIVDTGARSNLYCADATRTYCSNPSKEQKKLFTEVKNIQKEIIDMIEPGVKISRLSDKMVEMAEEAGYDKNKNILHSLGHSIGIEVHERPSISSESEGEVKENMVLAIEPGIYIPDLGGVRIEDTVLVTENGAERLSTAQRKL